MVESDYTQAIPREIYPSSVIRAHLDSIDFIKLLEKGSSPLAVSASHDKTLKVWDLNTQRNVVVLAGHTEGVYCCDVSDSGQVVSCSPDQTVRLWDPKSGREISRGLGHTYKIYYVIFVDNTHIVSCGRDKKLLLWDTTRMNAPVMRYGDDASGIFRSVTFFNDKIFASTENSGVEIYDYKTGRNLLKQDIPYDSLTFSSIRESKLPPSIIYCIKGFKDGQVLTAHQDMNLRKFSFSTQLDLIYYRRAHYDSIRHIEISSDYKSFITTGQDGSVRLWEDETPRASLVGHTQVVSCACITNDKRRVITSSYDQTISIFNIN
jgi:WD40 repeat protein